MGYNRKGISESQMQLMFRKAELENRAVRRAIILNHSALSEEPLSPQEQEIDRLAKAEIKREQEKFLMETDPTIKSKEGYFKTLVKAFKGDL